MSRSGATIRPVSNRSNRERRCIICLLVARVSCRSSTCGNRAQCGYKSWGWGLVRQCEYRKAVTRLTKMPKDMEVWISTWEQIMAKGQRRNVAFANDIDGWFQDFLAAVGPLFPSWTTEIELHFKRDGPSACWSFLGLCGHCGRPQLRS